LRLRAFKAIVATGDWVFTRYLTELDSLPMVLTAHDIESFHGRAPIRRIRVGAGLPS
jgi:hypothetical protein